MENYHSQKFAVSKVILLLLFIVPLMMTAWFSTQQVHVFSELLQLFFILLLLSGTIKQSIDLYHSSRIFRWVLFAIVVLYCGWLFKGIAIFEIYRTLHYPVYLLFFVSMIHWFATYGDAALLFVFKVKIWIIAAVMLFFYYYIFYVLPPANYIDSLFFINPPIYNHLRHMNYDMAMVIVFTLFLYCKENGVKKYLYLIMLFCCGFFTVWSAARGQTMSLVAFLMLLGYFGIDGRAFKKLAGAVAIFVVGGACVFLTSHTYYILERSNFVNANNVVNKVSSNRIMVWEKAITTLKQDYGLLFGFGPDAWVRSKLFPGMSQPHNFLLQWLFEFGVPVSILLLAVMYQTVKGAFQMRHLPASFSLEKTVAALLLSTFVYALVDGQFYHTIPFTMILIMGAYLFTHSASMQRNLS